MERLLYANVIGEGQPFVILHGFLGMSDNWKTLGMKYAQQGYEVHLLDLRNHGRSFHSSEFDYKVMTEDVVHYIQKKELENVTLLGHSMGGKVAMFSAILYPEYINKLIVADIAPKYYSPHHQNILQALQSVDFTLQTDRGKIEQILRESIHEEGVVQFLMKSVYRISSDRLDFRFNLKTFVNNQDVIGEAIPDGAIFDKPTLFIRGGKSDYVKDVDLDSIKQHFPFSEVKTIYDAGHWLHAEKPLDFFQITSDFLR